MFSLPLKCADVCQIIVGKVETLRPGLSKHVSVRNVIDPPNELNKEELNQEDLPEFIKDTLSIALYNNPNNDGNLLSGKIFQEAREDIRSAFDTTQIFIKPVGDWTKQLHTEVSVGHRSACWVRGPYVSPYSIASDFSRLVLVATGIGITPALGVMGQYKGFSRFKVLVWSTRCSKMLKFFLPLLKDVHLAVIYYTGPADESLQNRVGNVFIQKSRPRSLTNTLSTLISCSTEVLNSNDTKARSSTDSKGRMKHQFRKQWCIFYCGGSKRILGQLQNFSKTNDFNFEYELFDN